MRIFYDYQIAVLQRYGGVSRYHYELMKEINKTDNKAEMGVLFPQNYYLSQYLKKRGIKHYKKIKWIEKINQLYCIEQISTKRYDIIHPTWLRQYLIPTKKRKVITIHDMIPERCNLPFHDDIVCKRKWIENADRIIAISFHTKKDILLLYPHVNPDKIDVVYHGKNELPFPQVPTLEINNSFILYIGNRGYYKNGMLLIHELSEYILDKQITIIYAGGGPFSKEEKDIIQRARVMELVVQMQPDDHELSYLYRHALCCVYPSEYEGFGFPLLEAFSCSCPIVCANRSCLPEIGKDGAEYFDPAIKGDLLAKVEKITNDVNYRDNKIAKGLKRASDFSWEKTAKDTLSVYQKIQ